MSDIDIGKRHRPPPRERAMAWLQGRGGGVESDPWH